MDMKERKNDILVVAFTALKYKSKYIKVLLVCVSPCAMSGLTKEDLYLHTLCKEWELSPLSLYFAHFHSTTSNTTSQIENNTRNRARRLENHSEARNIKNKGDELNGHF